MVKIEFDVVFGKCESKLPDTFHRMKPTFIKKYREMSRGRSQTNAFSVSRTELKYHPQSDNDTESYNDTLK